MKLNRVGYLLFLGYAIAFVVAKDSAEAYAALYLALALPVLSYAAARICVFRFVVKESVDRSSLVKGDAAEYLFEIANRSFLPFTRVKAFFFAEDGVVDAEVEDQTFSVPSFGRAGVKFPLTCVYRGEYRLGVRKVEMYDVLGLFKFKKGGVGGGVMVRVSPRVVTLSDAPFVERDSSLQPLTSMFAGDDYLSVSDLREYAPGDPFRRVHWKATARRGELIVKNYQIQSKNLTTLVVDNGAGLELPVEDAVVEALVSVAKLCGDERYPAFIVANHKPPTFEPSDFVALYAEAAALKFGVGGDAGDSLTGLSIGAKDLMNVVLFTNELTRELKRGLTGLGVLGHNAAALVVGDEGAYWVGASELTEEE